MQQLAHVLPGDGAALQRGLQAPFHEHVEQLGAVQLLDALQRLLLAHGGGGRCEYTTAAASNGEAHSLRGRHLDVVDVDVLLDDGRGLLVHFLLAQGGLGGRGRGRGGDGCFPFHCSTETDRRNSLSEVNFKQVSVFEGIF